MKTEDIPKHRSCKRQKDIKAHLHAHLKTRLRMMPSSLLGCASQFVSGYPYNTEDGQINQTPGA